MNTNPYDLRVKSRDNNDVTAVFCRLTAFVGSF